MGRNGFDFMRQPTNASIVAAVCIALTSVSSALAQTRGFYIKGDVGGNVTQDIDLKEFFGPVAPGSKVKMDAGIRAGVTGGYQVCDWFAAEAELGVMENTINSITGAT